MIEIINKWNIKINKELLAALLRIFEKEIIANSNLVAIPYK